MNNNTNTNTTSTTGAIWAGVKSGAKYVAYAGIAVAGAYFGVKAYERFGKTTFSELPTPSAEETVSAIKEVVEKTTEIVKDSWR